MDEAIGACLHELKLLLGDYAPKSGGEPTWSHLALAERAIRDRTLRRRYLRPGLFYEPDWDMLLDLYAATLRGKCVGVSSLCIAANIPPTTALRHITVMERHGELIRIPDPHDRRRWFLRLSQPTFDAITAWLTDIG